MTEFDSGMNGRSRRRLLWMALLSGIATGYLVLMGFWIGLG